MGELAAFDDRPRSASVLAATRVTARVISQSRFLAFLDGHPVTDRAVTRTLSAKMRTITQHRVDVTGAPVLVRLARVLYRLVESHSTPCPEGWRIEVALSQPEIAALIGAAQPSLHRALAQLRDRGVLITRRRTQIVADLGLLEKISRDEEAS
ncbi:Crp/Fnr family transcriptional regulator [Catenulispora yoronensis]